MFSGRNTVHSSLTRRMLRNPYLWTHYLFHFLSLCIFLSTISAYVKIRRKKRENMSDVTFFRPHQFWINAIYSPITHEKWPILYTRIPNNIYYYFSGICENPVYFSEIMLLYVFQTIREKISETILGNSLFSFQSAPTPPGQCWT